MIYAKNLCKGQNLFISELLSSNRFTENQFLINRLLIRSVNIRVNSILWTKYNTKEKHKGKPKEDNLRSYKEHRVS